MTDVTRILSAIERGEAQATDELLPLVYEELRLLAAQKLSHESPGQTLQATALVHEAYLRLVGDTSQSWDNRGHFFAAAAEAMRRILVENARRKRTLKRGADQQRVELGEWVLSEQSGRAPRDGTTLTGNAGGCALDTAVFSKFAPKMRTAWAVISFPSARCVA